MARSKGASVGEQELEYIKVTAEPYEPLQTIQFLNLIILFFHALFAEKCCLLFPFQQLRCVVEEASTRDSYIRDYKRWKSEVSDFVVYHVHLALKEFFNQKCWERNQIKVQINSLQHYTSNLAGGVPIYQSILPRLFKTPQNIKPAPRIEGGGAGGNNSNGNGKFKRQSERDDLRNKKKAKVSRKCPLPEGLKAEIEKCMTKSQTHEKKFVQMATL